MCGNVNEDPVDFGGSGQNWWYSENNATLPNGCIVNGTHNRFMNYNANGADFNCTKDYPCRCRYKSSAPTSHIAVTSGTCDDHENYYAIRDATECENIPISLAFDPDGGFGVFNTGSLPASMCGDVLPNNCVMLDQKKGTGTPGQQNIWFLSHGTDCTGTTCSQEYPCFCKHKGKPTTTPQPQPQKHHPVATPGV